MCLALPYRVVEVIDSESCIVEGGGRRRHVFYDEIPDLTVGDYVVVEANIVLDRVPESEAQRIIAATVEYVFGAPGAERETES
ncbi:Hydrogenase accessory protein [Candidatus Hydrogenisulfobacillus filiaventi]|uniref:Hydrogenase accessory protein n=1 Tax=Candidatus Hydrogenisulfobacillus filiaventi TaxID=2707344 RepID=A0A6F8ZF59_9FIRM|nr:Hydrogenase accessory protein [Candidatus Hydrogenisulfobacillus filiaventi]